MVCPRGVRGCRNGRVNAFAERWGEGNGQQRAGAGAKGAPAVPVWPKHNRRATDKEAQGHRTSTIAERRTQTPGSGGTVVACLDVQQTTHSGNELALNELLWRLALRRMERCIRPDDQVCMLGGPRVAVVLGNGSNRLAPSALGKRLARAIGDHLAVGATGLDLDVAIGIGAGTAAVEPSALAAAAMASLRFTRGRTALNGRGDPSPLLMVTYVPDHQAQAHNGPVRTIDLETSHLSSPEGASPPRRLDHRVLVPLSEEVGPFTPTALTPSDWNEFGATEPFASSAGAGLRVLLIDPSANPEHIPRPGMEAVAAVARRLGARPALSLGLDPDAVLLDLYLTKSDVAVIVVQAEVPRYESVPEAHYTWDRPARITRALRAVGTPVIALSVGASAAALAVCVEQGAVGLLHTDLLSQELARQASRRLSANGGQTQNGYEDPRGPGQLPAPYDALVHLTPSERRVLFHMMAGRSASEIATTLVVSLTTVRSHIRSILRKLNVNSQLAAVALAFGTLPDQALAE